MGMLGTIEKQPREIIPIEIDYADVIDGRTATALTSTVDVPSGMALVSQSSASGVTQLYVSGGDSGSAYRWSVVTDITIGGRVTRVEDDVVVVVREITSDTSDADGTYAADCIATPAGDAAPVLPRRVGDSRTYTVDMRKLLQRNESLLAVASSVAGAGLTVGATSVINGQFFDIQLSGGSVPPTQPHQDYSVSVVLTTSRGAVQASITVRTYP